jgi:WD40 repeat protein
MRFFPGSEELLLVGRHDAGVWEATGRAVKHPFTPQSGGEPRRSLGAISPDGRWMAISTRNRIEIWDRRTWKRTIDGHAADCISELAVSPGGTVVATLALGNIIQIWEIPSGRSLARYQVHPLRIHNLAFTPDGKRLVFIEENEKDVDRSKVPKSERPPVLRVRDVFTGDVDREFKLRADVDRGFAVSPVEPLAAVCARKSVLLVDLTTGRLRSELQGAGDGEMAFSPDGGTLICDTSGRSEVWDVDSGVKLYEAAQIVTPTTRLAFSHAGNLLMPFAERNPVNKTSSLTIYETASGLVARTVVMPGSRSGRDSFAPAPSKVLGITKPYSVVLPIRNALSWTVSDIRARKSAGTPFRPWPGEYLCEVTSDGNYCMTMYIFSGGNRPVTVWRTPAEIRRGTRRDRELSEEELGRNWEQLHADPGAALDAFFTLVEGGKSTVDYLRQSLNPARPLDRKRVKELIAALDSDQFKERDAAKAELRIYRSHIEDELHAALESAQSLEVRDSVDHILRQPPDVLSQNRKEIAQIRSIFVLTSIGTDSARELIKHLATGAPEHRQTVYAQRALSFLQCQREQEQQSVR